MHFFASYYRVDLRVNGSKFLLRKCCGPWQVYHISSVEGQGPIKRCVNYSTTSHPSPTLIEVSQQLFLIQDNVHHRRLGTEDFHIEDGFPRNCSQENLVILEPDIMQADRFYPLVSGDLVVLHRFWLFHRDDYCMEDFFINDDFNKVRFTPFIFCVA